jgi:hypothetical protein
MPVPDGSSPARSAIAQARKRLGDEPMEHLFATLADRWAHESAARHRWRGLSLYGADGTTLRVPDSKENWDAFGGQPGNGERAGSAYPLVRLVAVMALRSHLLAAVRFGAYNVGEVTLADQFWSELPDDSLTILDRGFLCADDLTTLQRGGNNKHWMVPAKSTTRLRKLSSLAKNDWLVEIELSEATRKAHPDLPMFWLARAITYKKPGFEERTLLTSLGNPLEYPRDELIALYHERWELELGYDEIKTHMLDRQEAIRSRTPMGVRQELWGVLIAYNLVRVEMERAAGEIEVPPTQISFVAALSFIRYAWISASTRPLAPGKIPKTLLLVRSRLKMLVLPPRRPERRAPRAVKIKMSNYARKPPTGRGRK